MLAQVADASLMLQHPLLNGQHSAGHRSTLDCEINLHDDYKKLKKHKR